jgi:hypothetical protein
MQIMNSGFTQLINDWVQILSGIQKMCHNITLFYITLLFLFHHTHEYKVNDIDLH